MKPTAYILSDNMISSLGFSTQEHITAFRKGQSGISTYNTLDSSFFVSKVNEQRKKEEWAKLNVQEEYTNLEQLFILSISKTLENTGINPQSKDTLFILSSTKGNIEALSQSNNANAFLGKMAKNVGKYFNLSYQPQVISTACISGTLACVFANRYIRSGRYKHVIVSGGDIISDFTLSGFNSFKALGTTSCKPFDKNRDGVNLGEGVGTILFSSKKRAQGNNIYIGGGASSNDANHISGPSRTGDGLFLTIKKAMEQAGLSSNDLGYISAHGTATPYNDEMEAKAFHLAQLQDVPLNSFKGYFGHTLGAAGILESIGGIQSLLHNELYPSPGFEEIGVSQTVPVIKEHKEKQMNHILKTASGFGGCNSSIIFSKE